jgi:hypothetical protein
MAGERPEVNAMLNSGGRTPAPRATKLFPTGERVGREKDEPRMRLRGHRLRIADNAKALA